MTFSDAFFLGALRVKTTCNNEANWFVLMLYIPVNIV